MAYWLFKSEPFKWSWDMQKAKDHILQAAGPYSMDHYMGRVASVHARVRGWLPLVE